MKVLLKNGSIVTNKLAKGNILIDNGLIADVGNFEATADKTVDCTGKIIVPGLIDMHVHFREPGQEYKEDIKSGSEAAVAGGVTTACCMANTKPVIDDSSIVSRLVERSREVGLIDLMPYACVTKGMKGEELTEMGDLLSAGACGFSDDGRPVMNSEVMRRALEYAGYFGAYVAAHEEDVHLFNNGAINEGYVSTLCGMRGAPAEAESVMVGRDIELARLTGGKLHICHVSSRHSVELIRRGKENGINVTAEVTPNHLLMTEDVCASFDTNSKVNPPLRAEIDRQALINGLKDGTLDVVATDHAPHHLDDKFKEYDLAAFGMIGIQFTVPFLIKLINEKIITWADFARTTSENPAEILRLSDRGRISKNLIADLAVIDPNQEYIFDGKINRSKSSNTLFMGKMLKGKAVMTFKRGKLVYDAKDGAKK